RANISFSWTTPTRGAVCGGAPVPSGRADRSVDTPPVGIIVFCTLLPLSSQPFNNELYLSEKPQSSLDKRRKSSQIGKLKQQGFPEQVADVFPAPPRSAPSISRH